MPTPDPPAILPLPPPLLPPALALPLTASFRGDAGAPFFPSPSTATATAPAARLGDFERSDDVLLAAVPVAAAIVSFPRLRRSSPPPPPPPAPPPAEEESGRSFCFDGCCWSRLRSLLSRLLRSSPALLSR